jgi:hypothetical protein
MVVKENFSRDMVDMLAHDMHVAMRTLGALASGAPRPHRAHRRPVY